MTLKLDAAKPSTFLNKAWVQEAVWIVLAVSFFALILLNRSPNILRPLSLHARTGFNVPLFLLFLLLYLSFRLRGGLGRAISFILTLALFALALAGLWAIGQTQSTVLSGIIPLYDAADYYTDALRLQAGEPFSDFSARRPLFAGLLSLLLRLTGQNLAAALGLLTLITAIACYLAAREIRSTHGPEAAVFVLAILFLFYRHHSGTVMSENLGVPLGALGFALMWRGTAQKRSVLFWSGLFVTTLALNARAGAFFTLPLLICWSAWMFRGEGSRFSWKVLIVSAAVVFAAFTANLILVRLLSPPSGVPFANFSYTLYGLASGGESWYYVFQLHPELLELPADEQSRIIYGMAFDLIQEDPGLLVQGALFNWSMLFSDTWYSAYSYVGGESHILRNISQWSILVLCVLGFIRWVRRPGDPLTSLVGISMVGILLSVPFLPPTDAYRMRPYAVSIIVFGLLPALGLHSGMQVLKLPFVHNVAYAQKRPRALVVLTSLLVAALLFGPLLVNGLGRPPQLGQASCEPGLDLVSIRFDPSTHFNLLREREPGLDWLPNFHIGRFRKNAHSLPDPNMIDWAEGLGPVTSVFYTLDYQTYEKVLVVAATTSLPAFGSIWQVCGEWEGDPTLGIFNIFYVREEASAR